MASGICKEDDCLVQALVSLKSGIIKEVPKAQGRCRTRIQPVRLVPDPL